MRTWGGAGGATAPHDSPSIVLGAGGGRVQALEARGGETVFVNGAQAKDAPIERSSGFYPIDRSRSPSVVDIYV